MMTLCLQPFVSPRGRRTGVPGVRSGGTPERRCSSRLNEASDYWRWFADDGEAQHDQRFPRFRTRSWFVLGARHSSVGDGSYLYFIRNTEIHAPVRKRHCPLHFQQSVRLVAVYLRGQRRGLSARHHRVNDGRSSRGRRIHPDSIGTRLIAGNWLRLRLPGRFSSRHPVSSSGAYPQTP